MDYHLKNITNIKNLPFNLSVFDASTAMEKHVYPRHFHSHLEIVFTIEGKGDIWVDGNQYNITSENVFLISPNSIHQVTGYPPYENNIGYCLQIDLEHFKPLFPELGESYHMTCSKDLSLNIIRQCKLLHQEIDEDKDEFDLVIRIIKILQLIKENAIKKSIPKDYHRDLILKVSKYIQNHYDEALTIELLAKKFNFSVSYLQKICKDYFQQSIHQYITDIRMEHALADLKHTNLSIIEIAIKNGFSDSKSFTREFKKRFEITPAVYRKEIK
ncbi:MAG: AraC family transcriptional regulator [Bacillota bacterium]|nr:AraC family transcriptional regulator [Bacillota bacterium]